VKGLWKDIPKNMRRPNSNWKSRNVCRWCEAILGLPHGAVSLRRPDGTAARADKTLGSLRKEWEVPKAPRLLWDNAALSVGLRVRHGFGAPRHRGL